MSQKFTPNKEMSVLVELQVNDFEKATTFYTLLGFSPRLSEEGDYLIMKKGQNNIRFYKGNRENYTHPYFGNFSKETKNGFNVEIIIFVEDVKKMYEKIKLKVNVVEHLKHKRWGAWDFRVEDPFGFYLRISEPDHAEN